jgi:hypothetical protein
MQGHSWRAGFATTAQARVAEHLIMKQGSWGKSDIIKKYTRESNT